MTTDLPTPVHAWFTVPDEPSPPPTCHRDESEARAYIRALTRLAGPSAAAHRVWTLTACACAGQR